MVDSKIRDLFGNALWATARKTIEMNLRVLEFWTTGEGRGNGGTV
jgi:hypothetical protein